MSFLVLLVPINASFGPARRRATILSPSSPHGATDRRQPNRRVSRPTSTTRSRAVSTTRTCYYIVRSSFSSNCDCRVFPAHPRGIQHQHQHHHHNHYPPTPQPTAMPSRKSDVRRSDVSVARFVLADEDSTMATDSPATEPTPTPAPAAPAAPAGPSAPDSVSSPQQQSGDKKDKEREREREKEKERERERDALTLEVCCASVYSFGERDGC